MGKSMKLLFSDDRDISDVWGKVHFGTTPLREIGTADDPGFIISCCVPGERGFWDVYGHGFNRDEGNRPKMEKKATWSIHHAQTKDGLKFENCEKVFESKPGPWNHYATITYSPDRGEFLVLKCRDAKDGFDYMAFFSTDGKDWTEYPGNPVYNDGDSWGNLWSGVSHRYVSTGKAFKLTKKKFPDNAKIWDKSIRENKREPDITRVLSVRASKDGRTWEPDYPIRPSGTEGLGLRAFPRGNVVEPDKLDPPELEFYRGFCFSYHDRCFMMMLNYAPSPLDWDKHGPQLDTEWWLSHDGLVWTRPYRHINATPASIRIILHNPLIIDRRILFHYHDGRVFGMEEDRITYVGARANAEFSTVPFVMPEADLCINAGVPAPDRRFSIDTGYSTGTGAWKGPGASQGDQSYLMAAVTDGKGKTVEGFEREKCLIRGEDRIDIPLGWQGRSARELAGRKIALRLFMRSANVYAVSCK